MPQSRVDYWWEFIENNEKLYLLCKNNIDQDINSFIYENIKRLIDYMYGYNTDTYNFGINYGSIVVPYGQNIFISSDSDLSKSATSNLIYDIECVNYEYNSSPHGQPIITSGSFNINNQIYSSTNSVDPIYIIEPPSNLKNVIITCSVFLDINAFLNYIYLNNSILSSIYLSIVVEFNEYSNQYILENKEIKFNLSDNYSKYIRNIFNEKYFPQKDQNNFLDLSRIIFRINDTTNDHNKYEYYLIDCRKLYGYFGFKQIDVLNIIASLNNYLQFTNDNAVKYMKLIFSYLFNDMGGVGNEFHPDFITFFTDQGKVISSTLQDLYDELHI